jgi:triphosphatase
MAGCGDMNEFEIKLEVPQERAAQVERAVRAGRLKPLELRAVYFDTPERELQRRGIALRVRREGKAWLQTLKAESGKPQERLEHNVELATGGAAPPLPDLALHEGTDLGARAMNALADAAEQPRWQALFQTEVQRIAREVKAGESLVEIAFDRGRIVTGDEEIALCEIEFELKEGFARDCVTLAQRWCAEHGLSVSTTSKAEKGRRLAHGMRFGAPAEAQDPEFGRHAALEQVAHAALASALDQVLRNASDVAAGAPGEEHVHQLRVGIRRTRTALRELFGGQRPEEPPLIEAFRALGRQRDVQHVLRSLEPAIEDAGGPVLRGTANAVGDDPGAIVRSPSFQYALLALVALAHEPLADGAKGRATKEITRRLAKLHERTFDDGRRFLALDAARQHRVRKRLKRLRYLAEFARPLFASHRVGAWLHELKPLQDALGLYNDQLVALAHYRGLTAKMPQAWFGVGWLSARREAQAAACARALHKFGKVEPFWK